MRAASSSIAAACAGHPAASAVRMWGAVVGGGGRAVQTPAPPALQQALGPGPALRKHARKPGNGWDWHLEKLASSDGTGMPELEERPGGKRPGGVAAGGQAGVLVA